MCISCKIGVVLTVACTTLGGVVSYCPAGGFDSENISLFSRVTLAQMNAQAALDCWGYTSKSGREYAIIGLGGGTQFVEITDPANPVLVEKINHPVEGKDIKVYQHYAYVSSDSGPIQVIDMGGIDDGIVTLVNSEPSGTHNLYVNEESGHLYLAGGGVMVAVDLSDPVEGAVVGIWFGEAHDALVVNYNEGEYAGREIAFISGGWAGNLDIVDVTDKGDMFLVGSESYPSAAYTHQAWLSADRQLLYVNDELDDIQRTLVIDVSDLEDPTLVNEFSTGLNAIDHNLYVDGGFIFQANYTSGLRVFDANVDPIDPPQVGFFDTFPAHDGPDFEGAWSNYPFFPSGTVIVSDRTGGLFVLDVSAITGGDPCPADVDGDGNVGTLDLIALLGAWGDPGGPADINGDGTVNTVDLLELLGAWGPCP